MTAISGKRVLLGITGGVAAYKAGELVRLLGKAGADVRVAMTASACRFITPVTFQALSGQPVFTDMWDARVPDNMGHIELSRDRDLVVIAPATANFMAKLANGLADDLLSTLCVARRCPLAIAPAMNVEMWNHPATQRNVQRLAQDGVHILGPAPGEQACGETGMGRMLEPRDIVDALGALFNPKVLGGRKVVVTAGPTYEAIDTVRGITNRSSGKMGYAVAQAAAEAGADVTLVSGPTALDIPSRVRRVDVVSAREMHDAVMKVVAGADVFIAVAAVADYRVADPKQHKIKRAQKGAERLTLELEPNPDILAEVAALQPAPFCVGFAAETENVREYALEKRKRKGIPLLAANLATEAFGRDDNALLLFDDQGEHELQRAPKLVLARRLVEHIAKLLVTRQRISTR
jgi:phosphopantothenoylcysteine decarboxylase/phosphopantothenate--cysteine ligase